LWDADANAPSDDRPPLSSRPWAGARTPTPPCAAWPNLAEAAGPDLLETLCRDQPFGPG